MPQNLTPLYHTPVYSALSDRQRLRYNQLNALYFNEQIMFFERRLARNILTPFLARELPGDLKPRLLRFLEEEERHSAMFLSLNRRCAPDLYRDREFYFIQIPRAGSAMLNAMSRRPTWFPLFLWLAHLQEERSMFFAQGFLKSAEEIDPSFLTTQRIHLADEIGHVRCDQDLLDLAWAGTGRILRNLNARIFIWMMAEYFSYPKRAGIRVADLLVEEFSELEPHAAEIRRQLFALKDDYAFRCSLYGPHNVPDTFDRLRSWPEFNPLSLVMPGYLPAGRTS